MILEADGYTVLVASNATDAFRLASEHPAPIDLLLTDLVMPDINGRDLAARLVAAGIHAKHLFMSGYPADVDTGNDTSAYIQKPFTMNTLTTKIRDTLDSSPMPAPE